jgi:hypothetical protein
MAFGRSRPSWCGEGAEASHVGEGLCGHSGERACGVRQGKQRRAVR